MLEHLGLVPQAAVVQDDHRADLELGRRDFGRPTPAPASPTGCLSGRGIGGWRDDAIYMPQPYNGDTLGEVVLGVPARGNPNYQAINVP